MLPSQLKAEYRKRWISEYNAKYKQTIKEKDIEKNESLRIMFESDFEKLVEDARDIREEQRKHERV